jgi:hypothetical protein
MRTLITTALATLLFYSNAQTPLKGLLVKSGQTYTLTKNEKITSDDGVEVQPNGILEMGNFKITGAKFITINGEVKTSLSEGLRSAFDGRTISLGNQSKVCLTGDDKQVFDLRTDYYNVQLNNQKTWSEGSYKINGRFETDAKNPPSVSIATTVIFSGDNQEIGGGIFYNVQLKGGLKTLTDTIRIKGVLSLDENVNINTNDKLVIVSNATETGSIGPLGTSNNINGKVTVERFVPANPSYKWRFITAPVNNASIRTAWQQKIHITGPGNGKIPGTYNSNGFDATSNNTAGIYYYDETVAGNEINGWKSPASTIENFQVGKGYRIFIRGDKEKQGTDLITSSTVKPQDVTLRPIGNLQVGDAYVYLNCSNGCGAKDGWNLIGNPYPSPIDWSNSAWISARKNIVNPTIYVYNPKNNAYSSYHPSVGGVNGGTSKIASGQSFFVKAMRADNLIFKETYKSTAPSSGMFSKQVEENDVSSDIATIQLVWDTMVLDEVMVYQHPEATTSFNEYYDSEKFFSGAYSIATYTNHSFIPLVFNAIGKIKDGTKGDTVYLTLTVPKAAATYKLNIISTPQFSKGNDIYMYDAYTSKLINLEDSTSYPFDINDSSHAYSSGRFRFFIVPNKGLPVSLVSFQGKKVGDKNILTWTTASETNNASFIIEREGEDNSKPDEIGRVKGNGTINTPSTYTFTDKKPLNGLNYYRLTQVDNNGDKHSYNSILIHNETPKDNRVKIYPIPAQVDLYVEFNKYSDSESNIEIRNIDGKIVYNQTVNTTENNLQRIDISRFPFGIYTIKVSSPHILEPDFIDRFIKR